MLAFLLCYKILSIFTSVAWKSETTEMTCFFTGNSSVSQERFLCERNITNLKTSSTVKVYAICIPKKLVASNI